MIKCKNTCPLGKFDGCCQECFERLHGCDEMCGENPQKCGEAVFTGEALEVFKNEHAAVITQICEITKQAKALDELKDKMREELKNAMEKAGINKFENELIKITYYAASSATSVDTTKIKKDYPDIAAACQKTTSKKAYVKIDLV